MTKTPRYLLDVNALIALIDQNHAHNAAMTTWANTAGRKWAICPFAEAGFLRFATRPATGSMTVPQATKILESVAKHPGYSYHAVSGDWLTLSQPFFKRLHGHKQVTDAYLLGTAIHDGLILATFDQKLLHLAGEHGHHVHIIGAAN